MSRIVLKTWNHPTTGEARIYVNGTGFPGKLWITKGDAFPAVHGKTEGWVSYQDQSRARTTTDLACHYLDQAGIDFKTWTDVLALVAA